LPPWWTTCSACPGSPRHAGGGGFGRAALRCENRIFAMLARRRLVVKLPAPRVDALGQGALDFARARS